MTYEEHIVEPENALPEISLDEMPQLMREAAARAGWTELMPVQAKTIPYILAQRDLMVQSRTGSGKTGAFIMPILDRINPRHNTCQAIILVPTRELARQVGQEAELLAGNTGIRCATVYGGVRYGPQLKALEKGAHIVVGTPGRVLDHLLRRNLTLDDLEILVFDEADRMLSMGFYPDMKQVQKYLPRRRINAYMFSATYPPHVLRLAAEFLYKPDMLSLSRDRVHVAETEHVFYVVPAMEKDRCLVRIIEIENPTGAIIFCNTKAMVDYVTTVLQRFGYDADKLSADLSQGAREQVMIRERKGALRFLVATDLASRGIDIPELSHVIQYEPPEDPEAYVHRAGRTGRAGATGQAISLVAGQEQTELKRIAHRFGIEFVEKPVPTEADVEAIVSQRMIALLESHLRSRDTLQVERMQRFIPLARDLSQSEEESSLIAMLLDDYYQATLHKAPPHPELTEERPPVKTKGGGKKARRKREPRRRRK